MIMFIPIFIASYFLGKLHNDGALDRSAFAWGLIVLTALGGFFLILQNIS